MPSSIIVLSSPNFFAPVFIESDLHFVSLNYKIQGYLKRSIIPPNSLESILKCHMLLSI